MNKKRRTCIVSPKYEPAPQKKSPAVKELPKPEKKPLPVKINLTFNFDIRKLENSIKKYLMAKLAASAETIKSFEPIYKKTILTAIAAILLVIMFCTFLNLGFDAYINDKFIGTVRGYEETDAIIEEVNSELKNHAVETISTKPNLFMRIVPQNGFSKNEEVRDKLKLASGVAAEAVVFTWEGAPLFAVCNFQTALSIIKDYSSGFGGNAAGFDGDMKIEKQVCYENDIVTSSEAVKLLKQQNIPAITEENIEVKKVIEKPVNIKEDNGKRTNYSKVENEGEDGEVLTEVLVTKINGNAAYEKTMKETVVKEPVPKVMVVGTLPVPTGKGSGTFIVPLKGEITSHFGKRWGRQHLGTDFAGNVGDNIYASDEGVVTFSGTIESYGKIIIIDHKNGYTTRYAHCSQLYSKVGDIVGKGDVIAAVGNTGNSTGPHLHFEIRKDNKALNPVTFLNIK
jgi:murein DD-endopeptidase MepM/ murein hydrolase activator NlpD